MNVLESSCSGLCLHELPSHYKSNLNQTYNKTKLKVLKFAIPTSTEHRPIKILRFALDAMTASYFTLFYTYRDIYL